MLEVALFVCCAPPTLVLWVPLIKLAEMVFQARCIQSYAIIETIAGAVAACHSWCAYSLLFMP
jgi:hypothetical protein